MLAHREATLVELVGLLEEPVRTGPGRPRMLPSALLWASLAIGVLRNRTSQSAVWRLVRDAALWRGAQVAVSDQAVFKRLGQAGPSPMGLLFTAITALVTERVTPYQDQALAPFAREIVAIDQSTLDPVARTVPHLRAAGKTDHALLPGKIDGVYDIRRRIWRRVDLILNPDQNEKVTAPNLVADLPPGSLVLADRGYFSFAWFDALTTAGHFWISRVPVHVNVQIRHTLHEDLYRDELGFLGAARANRAAHLVRRVQFTSDRGTHTYLTNVTDPALLSVQEIAVLYARRWDIERAFKLVKRDLNLHLLWSAKPEVIAHQLWAVLLIAQILQFLQVEIAHRAGVPVDDVSLPLLVAYLPQYAATADDPIAAYIRDAVALRFIRPSRRIQPRAPIVPLTAFTPPPPDLVRTQIPRYVPYNSARWKK